MIKYNIITNILLQLLVFLLIFGCYVPDNPVSTEANNYQGFPTIDSIVDFAPALPVDGTSSLLAPTRIACTKLLGADLYHAQIATDAGFSDLIYKKDENDSNVFDISEIGFYEEGTFYIRFMVQFEGSWSDWTDIWSFKVLYNLSVGVIYAGGIVFFIWMDREAA